MAEGGAAGSYVEGAAIRPTAVYSTGRPRTRTVYGETTRRLEGERGAAADPDEKVDEYHTRKSVLRPYEYNKVHKTTGEGGRAAPVALIM